MDEWRRRSTGRRRSGVAGIQNEHACTAAADGHIRSAIGSTANGDQRFVARRGRRIGDFPRDRAGEFDETNADGAARDLNAAGRAEAGQRDHGRLAVRPLTRTGGVRGLTCKTVGTGMVVSPQGSASMPSARSLTNV